MTGTGKFAGPEVMRDALDASGCEIVTVALRRADLTGKGDPFANILDFIDPKKYLLLPNTSGAMNAEEAARRGHGRMGETGDSSRPALPAPRPCRDAEGRRGAREGWVQGTPLHQRRSRAREAPRGRGNRDGDAARLTHRQQPRHRDACADPDHPRPMHGARRGGRGPWRPEPGGGGAGDGRIR